MNHRFDVDPRVERIATEILWAATGWPADSDVDAKMRDLIRVARNQPIPLPEPSPVAASREVSVAERRELERLFKLWDRTTRADPYDADAARLAWHAYVDYGRTIGIPDPASPYA